MTAGHHYYQQLKQEWNSSIKNIKTDSDYNSKYNEKNHCNNIGMTQNTQSLQSTCQNCGKNGKSIIICDNCNSKCCNQCMKKNCFDCDQLSVEMNYCPNCLTACHLCENWFCDTCINTCESCDRVKIQLFSKIFFRIEFLTVETTRKSIQIVNLTTQ